jgi:outer membrane biosynthesis protein TonB
MPRMGPLYTARDAMSFIVLHPYLEQIELEADRRFRRVISAVAVPALVFAVAVQFIHLTASMLPEQTPESERYARLLQELERPPAPVPEPKVEEPPKAEETAKADTPSPKVIPKAPPKPAPKRETIESAPGPTQEQRVASARAKASRSGVMAFADQLADLRSNSAFGPDASTPLQAGVLTSRVGTSGVGGGNPGAFDVMASRGSGGIGDGAGPVTSSGSGPGLGGRGTARVASRIGGSGGPGGGGSGGKGAGAGRTLEEIQLTFDRNKGALAVIFNRALRDDPSLGAGKVVVNLTIAPDGSVTDCRLVTSTFNRPDLERKIVQRVMLFNFGAKPVPPYTYPDYPINLLPS